MTIVMRGLVTKATADLTTLSSLPRRESQTFFLNNTFDMARGGGLFRRVWGVTVFVTSGTHTGSRGLLLLCFTWIRCRAR
jgi:hypothetical protein